MPGIVLLSPNRLAMIPETTWAWTRKIQEVVETRFTKTTRP